MGRLKGNAMAKNTICVWYDKDAEAAARFYAETFPESSVVLSTWTPATTHLQKPKAMRVDD